MRVNSAIVTCLVVGLLVCVLTSYPEQETVLKTVPAICDEFEPKIKQQVNNEKYLDAISTAAEYEQALLSRYPPGSYELGLFQSQAHHLSFHSPFEGWLREDLKEMGIPEWLPAMGFDIPIALKGKVEDDKFVVVSFDMGKIMKRIGGDEAGKTELSDQELRMGAQAVAANFGVIKNEEFKTVADHRILVSEIGTPGLGPSIILASLARGGRIYGFLLTSSAGARTENEKRLYDLIKTVDFKYKPPDAVKIEATRQRVTGKTDISQLLACVRELALAGEYGAASDDLSTLRLRIAEKMPKPQIVGNVARYPAYGLSLTNPDPNKWKLSIEATGGMAMLVLEDRFSVYNAGVGVGVVNLVLAYGPQWTKLMGEDEDEDERKSFLSMAGRGGLVSMGGSIESERFRLFKGSFAYEGVASMNLPNTKVKALWIPKPGYALMVIMMVEASKFNEQSAEYETLLDKYLRVEAK